MRSSITFLGLFLIATFGASGALRGVSAQEHSYSSSKVGYAVDFPSPTWRLVDEPDELSQHTEFVYGDRVDGYLRIRKEALEPGVDVKEFARRDMDQKTRYLPGYVTGKEDSFTGRLNGMTVSYEFSQAGKPMAGRTYYLQSDGSSVYVLRFTGQRDKLLRIRNQTDMIARSLRTI